MSIATKRGDGGQTGLPGGVRVSKALKSVEFDGTVPIDVHGKAPRVFLEVLVCSSDTREHEALVVTSARPSQVHAALLMLGLAPGAPGAWRFEHAELKSTPPSGPRVCVRFLYDRDGAPVTEDASEWVVNLRGGSRLSDRPDEHAVFAVDVAVLGIAREHDRTYLLGVEERRARSVDANLRRILRTVAVLRARGLSVRGPGLRVLVRRRVRGDGRRGT